MAWLKPLKTRLDHVETAITNEFEAFDPVEINLWKNVCYWGSHMECLTCAMNF